MARLYTQYRIGFLFLLFSVVALLPLPLVAALEDEVRAFEAADAINRPPEGAILFVGSSTIRMWSNLETSFPRHTVINRGFGGSTMADALFYFDRLVKPYAPALIVLYEGDNDLAEGKTVNQVFAEYTNFLGRVEMDLPGTDVALVAVKPSPSRASLMPAMAALNDRLRALADGLHIRFVDVYTPMLNASNQPRPELFLSDMLHMNSTGYALWQSIFTPVLDDWAMGRGRDLLFDFGAATAPTRRGSPPSDPGRDWNNLSETNSSTGRFLTNLVSIDDFVTPLMLEVVEGFNGANENGTTANPQIPSSASRDSLYGNTELFNSRTNVFPKFKFTGLNPGHVCYFRFFASRTGASDNRETLYSLQGQTEVSATLNVANNITNWAILPGIAADSQGEILVRLTPGPNNTSPNHFTYLGVMHVTIAPPQTPIQISRHPEEVEVTATRPATFRVAASGARPYYFQWLSNGVPIVGATGPIYTIPSVRSDMNGAAYSVSVSNVIYGAVSATAILKVSADTNPPVLVQAKALSASSIELVFDEPISAMSTNPALYKVNGALPATVLLMPDAMTVRLALAVPIEGMFTVEIAGLVDPSGNSVAPGTRMSGLVPALETQAILIDFGGASTTERGPSPDDPTNHWNNLTDPSGSLPQLVTVENLPSGKALVMIRRFNGANLNGSTAPSPFPVDATRDSMYGNTEAFGGLANVFPSFKITGLDTAERYDLMFYASRTGAGDNRETLYTVEGVATNTATLDASNNATNTATLASLQPNGAGELVISLRPGPRNNNANHFTYLGVLRIAPTPPLKFLSPVVRNDRIELYWRTAGILEWAPSPTGPWSNAIPQPNNFFTEDIQSGQNRFYRLRKP